MDASYGMGVGLNIVLNVILIRFLGAQGLAFSTSFCSTVIMAALLLSFKQKVKEFYLGTVVKGFFQSLLAGLVMAVIVTISMTLMSQLIYDGRIIMKLLVLGVPATLGIASYVISLYAMKIPELRHFLKLLKKG